jgi:hypothetical protein
VRLKQRQAFGSGCCAENRESPLRQRVADQSGKGMKIIDDQDCRDPLRTHGKTSEMDQARLTLRWIHALIEPLSATAATQRLSKQNLHDPVPRFAPVRRTNIAGRAVGTTDQLARVALHVRLLIANGPPDVRYLLVIYNIIQLKA